MAWKAVPMEPAETAEVGALLTTVFGQGPAPSEAVGRTLELATEPDRVFVVHDGARVVGTGGAFSFDVALPGGAAVPMTAVTNVGVTPTHRRRGMLREIIRAVVDQGIERGEPIAGLTASEATIYRRFGFGPATRFQTVSIDSRRLRLAEAVVGDRGVGRAPAGEPVRMHLATPDEGRSLLPDLWARTWHRSAGELSRTSGFWAATDVDPEEERGGATARFVAVHTDAAGEPDGAATYRLKWGWESGGENLLVVENVLSASDEVETALLRHLLDVDLVTRFEWFAAPVDHPLRWWIADQRALTVTRDNDHLWLRPLDVARCLASRTYGGAGGLVVEVVDGDRPDLGGRFRLDAGPDGADCGRTSADPDVTLAMADLGSLLLGGVACSTLQRAGLVDEHAPGAVARADALFRPERPPYCGTDF